VLRHQSAYRRRVRFISSGVSRRASALPGQLKKIR
jgi:hypothetical protein